MQSIGIFELLVLGALVVLPLLLLVVVIALVVAVASRNRREEPPHPDVAPCPGCGTLVSLEVRSCPQCGKSLR